MTELVDRGIEMLKSKLIKNFLSSLDICGYLHVFAFICRVILDLCESEIFEFIGLWLNVRVKY